MQAFTLEHLRAEVQRNCDVSDAKHGGDYHMCTFLMKMREYFRWEKRLPFAERLDKDAVGAWLADREMRWEALEEQDYAPLQIGGETFDPFDSDAVNRRLAAESLVYGAGLGQGAKPHFFLADLQRHEQRGPYSVLIAGREYARDLGAPPAMNRDDVICLRRESLRRMLWEQLESWRWSKPDNALGRAFACYDFTADLDGALEAMTDREIEAALLHEVGEYRAGLILGDGWNGRLLELMASPGELMARAVRDHLADCLVTLPSLLERGDAASIHFYMGNLTHMRQALFPTLEQAYAHWLETGSPTRLAAAAARGSAHWQRLALDILAVRAATPGQIAQQVKSLVEANHL